MAVAASLMLAWRPWAPRERIDSTPDPGPVLGTELRLVAPVGEVTTFEEFRWEYELEGAQYFRLLIYDAEEPFDPLVSEELDEPRWRPDDAEREALPRRLLWEVRVMETERTELAASAEAWR